MKVRKDGVLETTPVSAASLPLPSGAATSAKQLADGHNVTIDNSTGAAAVNIQDGGNSITIDGTVTATPSGTQDVDVVANSIGLATSSGQLADGHNVTVDNASGASAVNIQDGGNSITVDGAVAATQSGTWNVTDVSGTVSLPTGAATAAGQLTDGHNVVVTSSALPTGAATAANQLADGHGVVLPVLRSSTTTLVSAVTFNNTTTADTSSSVDCRLYRDGILYYELTESGTATDISMIIEGSYDDSNWMKIGDGFPSQLKFSDAAIANVTNLDEYVRIPQLPPYIRLQTDAVGTDASNTFTLSAYWTMTD